MNIVMSDQLLIATDLTDVEMAIFRIPPRAKGISQAVGPSIIVKAVVGIHPRVSRPAIRPIRHRAVRIDPNDLARGRRRIKHDIIPARGTFARGCRLELVRGGQPKLVIGAKIQTPAIMATGQISIGVFPNGKFAVQSPRRGKPP